MGAKLNRIKIVLVERDVSQKNLLPKLARVLVLSMPIVPIDCSLILRL